MFQVIKSGWTSCSFLRQISVPILFLKLLKSLILHQQKYVPINSWVILEVIHNSKSIYLS